MLGVMRAHCVGHSWQEDLQSADGHGPCGLSEFTLLRFTIQYAHGYVEPCHVCMLVLRATEHLARA